MDSFVTASGLFGYFFIMIFLMIVSIVFAKRKSAWIWYLAGAAWSFFSLYGKEFQADVMHEESNTTPYWTFYFVLLIITAFIILVRYFINNIPEESQNDKDNTIISEEEMKRKDERMQKSRMEYERKIINAKEMKKKGYYINQFDEATDTNDDSLC